MRFETSFDLVGDLIVVDADVLGPTGRARIQLVVDTGAALTNDLGAIDCGVDRIVDDDDEKLTKLERQLFADVLELGDLRNLSGLEQVLYEVLSDDIDDPLAMDLSRIMVAQAEDVVRDPMRDMSNVPHGISRAERFAAYFEQDCPFCESRVLASSL